MGQSHSQSQTHISDLPNEVLLSILQYLHPQEMKSAVLVCKSLSEMGGEPKFWTWAVVTVSTKDDLQKLKVPRLQMVREINVTSNEVECTWIKEEGLADLFHVIAEIPTVRKIRGLEFCKGINDIKPDLVVSILNSLEHLKLCYSFFPEEDDEGEEELETQQLNLTTEQLELLFTAVAEKTNLKFLQMSGQAMDVVSPAFNPVFATALSNVEEVVLKEGFKEDITSKQYEALYTIIATEDRPIRKLKCLSNYIYPIPEMDPKLLSKAFNRLEEVTVLAMPDEEELTAILRGLLKGESRLKKLMFKDLNSEMVEKYPDQNLVSRAKEKIGEFYPIHPY